MTESARIASLETQVRSLKRISLRVICFLVLTAIFTGCTTEGEDLQFRYGTGVEVAYKPNQQDPFSGTVVRRYPDGQKSRKGKYLDGLQSGSWTSWHRTGEIQGYSTYNRGLLDGEAISFYPNGQKARQGSYAAGQPVGEHAAWMENGEILEKGSYKNGKKHGPWITDRLGTIAERTDYYNEGVLVKDQ